MKKFLLVTLVSTTAFLLFSGCTSSPLVGEESVIHSKEALYTHMRDDKHLKNLVIKAANETGWRTTEFTQKSIIAEKFDSDNPKATTIKIENGIIDFDNMSGTDNSDIVDLKEYIEDILESEQNGH